jgi:hypothetical protein
VPDTNSRASVPLRLSADKCELMFKEYLALPTPEARVDKARKVLDDHEQKLITGGELGTWSEERKLPLAVAATILLEPFVVPDAKRPFYPPLFLTKPPEPTAAPDQHPHPLRLVAALLGHKPRPMDGHADTSLYANSHKAVKEVKKAAGVPKEFMFVSTPDEDTSLYANSHKAVKEVKKAAGVPKEFMFVSTPDEDTSLYANSHKAVKEVKKAAGVPKEFMFVSTPDEEGRPTIRLSQYGLHKVVYERRSEEGLSKDLRVWELFGVFARAVRAHEQEVRPQPNTSALPATGD